MFEEGKVMAAKYGAENVYDFSLGNPSTPPPAAVREAAIDILSTEPDMMVHGYMSNAGYDDVRTALAQSINAKEGTAYTARNLVMTVGAAGGLNVALKTILEPGDEVLLLAPYFGEYINYIHNFGGVPVEVPADTKTFSIPFDEMEKRITDRTKAVIVNTPNNPTGVIYSEADLRTMASLLEAKEKEIGHAIYLISDEPYREIVFTDQPVPHLPKFYRDTLVGYSYSKALSLPGERIGYLLIPETVDDFENMVAAASVANRILGFVNAPSLFQRVIGRCADLHSDMTIYRKNKEVLYQALTAMGYECTEPQGAFYMFPKCFIPDDKEFCNVAKEYHLLIVPGSTFACPGYFRLAFCVSHETVQRSLPAFEQLAKRYQA
jgi:aspartate aminotransferase